MTRWDCDTYMLLTPGQYTFKIEDATETISRTGKPCMLMVLRVLTPGDFADEVLRQAFPKFKVTALASALGFEKKKDEQAGLTYYECDGRDFVGRSFSCEISHRDYNDQTYNEFGTKFEAEDGVEDVPF
jgi:hypothetical protein